MINIFSFFRKKRNIYFLIIIVILSIFNNMIINKYVEVDKKIVENSDEIFLIADYTLVDEIRNYHKNLKIEIIDSLEVEKHGIEISNDIVYYKVIFNRISLYEKYKDKAILLVVNRSYSNTLDNLSFYSIISTILIIISLIILIITILTVIYYEKSNIQLLRTVGYKRFQIFLVYLLNLFILLVPSILIYLINIMYLNFSILR